MPLPNFIVIGVAKAGTTSFFRYLNQHPQVYIPPIKGTNYFGYEDALDWRWVDEGASPSLQHFHVRTFDEYIAAFSSARDEIAIGEVSPQYFHCPTAARRIFEHLPDVKLIASLRNPAERAFSGFLMRMRRGEAVRSFDEELTLESSHVKEGFYYARLKRYFDLFPRQRIKIYIFEEFKKNPLRVLVDLFEFLGVDPGFVPDTSIRHNPGAVPKFRHLNRLFYHPSLIGITNSLLPEGLKGVAKQVRALNLKPTPKLSPDLRAELLNLYRQDILKLEGLLDRDLSIWLGES